MSAGETGSRDAVPSRGDYTASAAPADRLGDTRVRTVLEERLREGIVGLGTPYAVRGRDPGLREQVVRERLLGGESVRDGIGERRLKTEDVNDGAVPPDLEHACRDLFDLRADGG